MNTMTVISIESLNTKPDKLVLTKAEILAALEPIQNLAERINEAKGLFEAWHETLPTDENGEIIGYEDHPVEIADGDLDLYDALEAFTAHDWIYGNTGPLFRLIYTVGEDPAIDQAVGERRSEEMAAAKARRAEKSATTRKRNAQAQRERMAEKDRRIRELEEQLASKPKLSLVK
jgi:hypothetical protein